MPRAVNNVHPHTSTSRNVCLSVHTVTTMVMDWCVSSVSNHARHAKMTLSVWPVSMDSSCTPRTASRSVQFLCGQTNNSRNVLVTVDRACSGCSRRRNVTDSVRITTQMMDIVRRAARKDKLLTAVWVARTVLAVPSLTSKSSIWPPMEHSPLWWYSAKNWPTTLKIWHFTICSPRHTCRVRLMSPKDCWHRMTWGSWDRMPIAYGWQQTVSTRIYWHPVWQSGSENNWLIWRISIRSRIQRQPQKSTILENTPSSNSIRVLSSTQLARSYRT